jgi:hypothetical protein
MSRPMPYQPMGPRTPPAGDTEVAKMMSKLVARTSAAVRTHPKKEPLKWQDPVKTGPHGTGYMLSACGRFSIAKTTHELGFTYSAWDLSSKSADGGMATSLGCVGTKDEAIARCEAAR